MLVVVYILLRNVILDFVLIGCISCGDERDRQIEQEKDFSDHGKVATPDIVTAALMDAVLETR